jgi:hypothetical protein
LGRERHRLALARARLRIAGAPAADLNQGVTAP